MRTAAWTAGLAALACAGSLQAHHSGYMYERTPLWIEGTVVRVEHVNPHTVIWLEDGTEDGRQVLRWAVEGPSQSELDRIGVGMDVPKIGDVVQFCAFPYKSRRCGSL